MICMYKTGGYVLSKMYSGPYTMELIQSECESRRQKGVCVSSKSSGKPLSPVEVK